VPIVVNVVLIITTGIHFEFPAQAGTTASVSIKKAMAKTAIVTFFTSFTSPFCVFGSLDEPLIATEIQIGLLFESEIEVL
jgi:hypothetical protein